MTRIAYADIADDVQALLFNKIKDNVVAFTSNVYDGLPPKLAEGHGYPYIIVHTPSLEETMLTFTKVNLKVRVRIEVFAIKESNVREIIDRIRIVLFAAKAEFRASGLNNFRWDSGEPRVNRLTDNQNEWSIDANAVYDMRGTG